MLFMSAQAINKGMPGVIRCGFAELARIPPSSTGTFMR